ncbi:ATP-binding protein [Paucibacter sp. Y2R2-4]|uniref:ATP-binding protein n=1 Tax=Paucibacter sp. Y2R2-4 TaxID=2893553 RepID=UPI0021E4E420|nr:ATP-binding protein [Paucibacter sp. Y2R2-4]MCV2350596.1 GAF domain-containing protein [Paucibacter sp. Y2R2-4]
MELYVRNEVVQAWQSEMAQASLAPARRLELLRALNWHLRQREPATALHYGAELRALAPGLKADEARVLLVDAEIALMQARLGEARAAAEQAQALGVASLDLLIQTDAGLLLAMASQLAGQSQQALSHLQEALQAAQAQGDACRAEVAQLMQDIYITFRDPLAGRAKGGRGLEALAALSLGAQPWAHELNGVLAAQASNYGLAATERMRAYELSLASGQILRAILAAMNAADALLSLNDHELALQWMEQALQLARPRAWPTSLGTALAKLGETLRRMGRLDSAEETLREGEQLLAPMANSRNYGLVLKYQADLCLDRQQWPQALALFERVQALCQADPQPDQQINACRGRSLALAAMGRVEEALQAAEQALQLAQRSQHVLRQIESLKALAELHLAHALPRPADTGNGAEACLYFLRQALSLAEGIAGFRVPGDLIDMLAQAHARLGDMSQAYALARQAAEARQSIQSELASKRLMALQVMQQTERARLETEHLRQLAAEQAQRAEMLEQSMDTLQHLSQMGRDITASLEFDAVLQALARALSLMLGLDRLALAQLGPRAELLGLRRLGQDAAEASAAVALQAEEQALLTQALAEGGEALALQETGPQTGLCVLLHLGERLLGALFLPPRPGLGYEARDRLVVRTLCAYVAIALDNAAAHQRLRDAQALLVQQEKLAALGSLVAGVAHELNTPIGNCLLAASTLQERTVGFGQMVEARVVKLQDLRQYLADAHESSALLLRGLDRASDLVQRFKQVAADPKQEQRQVFALRPVCELALAAWREQAERAGVQLQLEVDAALSFEGYPGPLQQVLLQLLGNALLHAFEARSSASSMPTEAWVRLRAEAQADALLLQVIDNGKGITPEHLPRIFDPFFSTRFGQGGSGLGLHICHNLVHGVMQGQLRVRSQPGAGTCFELSLPHK